MKRSANRPARRARPRVGAKTGGASGARTGVDPSVRIPQVRGGGGAANRDGTFTVRPARQGDIAAVTTLDARITSLGKGPHWQELFDRGSKLRQAGQFFLVAAAGGESPQFLGFIVGEIRAWEFGSAPCGWVYALSVDPDARQLGVGEGLLDAIAEEFRRAGVNKMRTMVAKDNPLPMLFFRAEGMMAGPYIQLEKDLG
jgi:ribosomal protein S18 acetylase RimI-like enzyme